MARLLEERVEGPLGDTALERRVYRALRRAGLQPIVQYQVVIEGRVFVIDAALPDYLIALEVDGWCATLEPERLRA